MKRKIPIRPLLMSRMILLFFLSLNLCAQEKSLSYAGKRLSAKQATEINPELLGKPWAAKWISYPDNSNTDYGVFLLRKEISINTKPEKFIIHVSADNRYKLYINGVYVCNGPARSHLFKWNFETIDISP
ncbi:MULTISPECIES: hypothetical protein [Flavobacterium]|uniref:hypothetical protein n=1 Tax=Flavobacterium TaxID=237 RepID=UPI002113BB94|nr:MULTISPECIES: hypothetical protein [Flavobacterium]UUF12472.1 hypothetical protein NLJ00_14545 [Flavobacterium panici]